MFKMFKLHVISIRLWVSIAGLGTVAVFLAGCSRESTAYREGLADARRDIARGVLCIAVSDREENPEWFADYLGLLQQKYKIGSHTYSLPLHPELARIRASGYNAAIEPEIRRRFGTNTLGLAMAEAKDLHDRQRRK
jgi:hypothetical protein